ncbi:MAG: hypothetical protein KGO82_10100 [Bacteroidota bacterium]|nr:hypothetical protein [Bacteroidota bacterium]
MESIKALIARLQEQVAQNAGREAMLSTVQQLQLELTNGSASVPRQLGTAKVAVVMPGHARYMPAPQEKADVAVKVKPSAAAPVVAPAAVAPEEKKQAWQFDAVKETPTLAQQPGARELNDVIGNGAASLNDALKTGKAELASTLTDHPLRDLKKGIGINDRFVFLNELFRGDEAMYERSIKTINAFRILAEAEYWIERELKVKIGWDDSKEIVQHFYQLVRRRFS